MTAVAEHDQVLAEPHDLAAEQAALGAMLRSPEALATVAERLTRDDFHDPRHVEVFDAVCARYDRGQPVEVRLVLADLLDAGRLRQAGGNTYLLELVAAAPIPAQAGHFAARVAERALLRGIQRLGAETVQAARNTAAGTGRPVDELLGGIQRRLDQLTGNRPGSDTVAWGELYISGMEALDQAEKDGGTLPGLSTGLAELDRLTHGLKPGQLWIVAARPGAGKSVFALNLLREAALRHGTGVVMFSLEMNRQELFVRVASAESGVPQSVMDTGSMVDAQRQRLAERLAADAPIWVNDQTAITTAAIRAQARRLGQRHGIGLVIVDYLQLMATPKGAENRQAAVSEMSRALKTLASELEIPVVALSQLNRNAELRHDKRPQLSDLRESGSLEQDANVVILLHREDYYDPEKRPGEIDVTVAKNRGGPLDTVTAAAQLDRARIVGFSLDDPTPPMA